MWKCWTFSGKSHAKSQKHNHVLAPIVGKDLGQQFLLGIVLGVLEGLINRGFFWNSILTPSSVQCNVHPSWKFVVHVSINFNFMLIQFYIFMGSLLDTFCRTLKMKYSTSWEKEPLESWYIRIMWNTRFGVQIIKYTKQIKIFIFKI